MRNKDGEKRNWKFDKIKRRKINRKKETGLIVIYFPLLCEPVVE